MSDMNANSAFVRTEMLPEQAAPTTQVGVVKWLRENLFSSVGNALMTVISLYVIWIVLSALLPWIFGGVWNAGSLSECRTVLAAFGGDSHSGACWAVIEDRWLQLTFGFYPPELYWRPVLAFILLGVALAPVLFSEYVPRQLMIFSVLYPFLAVWLIWGGSIWVPLLVIAGFVIGYFAFQLVTRATFAGFGVAAGIVAAVLWWMFAVGAIDNTLNRMVGEARFESTSAELQQTLDAGEAAVAEREATLEALETEIAEVVAERDAIAALIEVDEDGHTSLPATRQDELLDLQATLTALRDDRALAARALTVTEAEISEARQRLGAMEDLREFQDADEVSENRSRVADIHADLGRVGLTPVESREIGGFLLAMILGVSGIVLSFPLGILLALGRQSDLLILKMFSVAFIEVIRGVPLIVWLITASLLLNYFLPPGTTFDLVLRVVIMVTFFASAYMAEVIRGGLAALPRGQYEGADSLGLDYSQSMRLIILPQALKISIPGIVSTFIGLFKDTVLVVFIGLLDPIGFSNSIRADTDWNGVYWEIFIFIGLCFFVFCYGMSRYSQYLERKLATDHR